MNANRATPRRRWFQFGLRTLLIFVVVAGCGMGWLGWQLKILRARNAALAEVVNRGGGYETWNGYVDESANAQTWNGEQTETVYEPPVAELGRVPFYIGEAGLMKDGGKIPSRVRRWLGDNIVPTIYCTEKTSPAECRRLEALFPEAFVRMCSDRDF